MTLATWLFAAATVLQPGLDLYLGVFGEVDPNLCREIQNLIR